jgi:hypothetical protein
MDPAWKSDRSCHCPGLKVVHSRAYPDILDRTDPCGCDGSSELYAISSIQVVALVCGISRD